MLDLWQEPIAAFESCTYVVKERLGLGNGRLREIGNCHLIEADEGYSSLR